MQSVTLGVGERDTHSLHAGHAGAVEDRRSMKGGILGRWDCGAVPCWAGEVRGAVVHVQQQQGPPHQALGEKLSGVFAKATPRLLPLCFLTGSVCRACVRQQLDRRVQVLTDWVAKWQSGHHTKTE